MAGTGTLPDLWCRPYEWQLDVGDRARGLNRHGLRTRHVDDAVGRTRHEISRAGERGQAAEKTSRRAKRASAKAPHGAAAGKMEVTIR